MASAIVLLLSLVSSLDVLCSWARHITLTACACLHPGVEIDTGKLLRQPDRKICIVHVIY